MSVYVTRAAGGISLNAGIREYLLDNEGEEMVFENGREARKYLLQYYTKEQLRSWFLEYPKVKEVTDET